MGGWRDRWMDELKSLCFGNFLCHLLGQILLIIIRFCCFPFPMEDSQPQPQCGFPDEFSGGIQVHSRPCCLPEACEISGGHHLHGEHISHQGERHLLRHLHSALRYQHTVFINYKLSALYFSFGLIVLSTPCSHSLTYRLKQKMSL